MVDVSTYLPVGTCMEYSIYFLSVNSPLKNPFRKRAFPKAYPEGDEEKYLLWLRKEMLKSGDVQDELLRLAVHYNKTSRLTIHAFSNTEAPSLETIALSMVIEEVAEMIR